MRWRNEPIHHALLVFFYHCGWDDDGIIHRISRLSAWWLRWKMTSLPDLAGPFQNFASAPFALVFGWLKFAYLRSHFLLLPMNHSSLWLHSFDDVDTFGRQVNKTWNCTAALPAVSHALHGQTSKSPYRTASFFYPNFQCARLIKYANMIKNSLSSLLSILTVHKRRLHV